MRNIYELPLILHEEGLDDVVRRAELRIDNPIDLSSWEVLVAKVEAASTPVRIGSDRQVRRLCRTPTCRWSRA